MPGPLLISDSEITGVLKRVYAGFREKVFPISTPLLANIEKGKPGGGRRIRWGGEGVFFDVVLTRPVGMTASDSGYLPPDSAATERQANVGVKRLYVTRQIDGLAPVGTQSKEAAFVNLARKILEEAKDASKLGMQEIAHGDGKGIKAEITVVNSTTSIAVEKPFGYTSAGQGGLLVDVDMYVAVLDASAAFAVLGRSRITAVTNSGDTATVTLGTAVAGMAAGDVLVAATTSDTSYNSFPNGLGNLLNRGGSYNSLHNLDAGTYVRWNTTRIDASVSFAGETPNEMHIWELATRVAGVSGKNAKEKPRDFLLLTTPGIEKQLAESFLGQRRFDSSSTINLKGGFQAVNICGIPVVSDFWCPAGTVYLVHLPSLLWIDAADWQPVQYESAGNWRFIQGRDAFETSFKAYLNLATAMRNAHGMIYNYSDTNRYSFVM
jgi:hypothetical protein